MKTVVEQEIVGSPVTVKLSGRDYPIAFPMFAIALYRQETARLNARRAKEAEESGRPRLTPAELSELRSRYNRLFQSRRTKPVEDLAAIMDEIVALRVRLDEEAGTGDSLLQYVNWWKIRDEDPDRILLALWAGLHQEQEDEDWKSPLTLRQLKKLVDFSNVGDVLVAIGKALAANMPKIQAEESASKNAGGPDRKMPADTESEEVAEMEMVTRLQ